MKQIKNTHMSNVQDPPVSAVYLSELTGLRPEDVHYWSRKGYIRNRGNGSKAPYFLGDLEKISLMKQVIDNLKMEARAASGFVDRLIEMHADDPARYEAVVDVVRLFDRSLDVLSELLVDLGFSDALKDRGVINSEDSVVSVVGDEDSKNGGPP